MSNTLPNPARIDQAFIDSILEQYNEGSLCTAFRAHARNSGLSPVTSVYLSDNGAAADLAIAEIKLAINDIHRVLTTVSEQTPPQTIYHDVPAQDWCAAAFDLAQLSRTSLTGAGNLFFVNCAPRLAQRGVKTNNQGEGVYVGMLPNGAIVSGTSPHSFAFFRDLVEDGKLEIYQVNVQTNGSQFRSRDFFPWFSELLAYNAALKVEQHGKVWKAGQSVEQRKAFLQEFKFIDTSTQLALENIPDLQETIRVARVDVHGNLKLSISRSDVPKEWIGKPLSVTIKGQTLTAEIREHMFDNNSMLAGIATGSSGHFKDSAKPKHAFLEMALMGKSLRDHLGLTDQDLKEGVEVVIQLAPAPNAPVLDAGLQETSNQLQSVYQ